MPRCSIAAAASHLAALFLCTGLMLSCNSNELPGPTGNRGPTARITLPSGPLLEGSEITLDATSSSDPEGDSLNYVWVVGNGVRLTGPLAVRTFTDEGSYDVTLIARDQDGASDTATARVSVENAAPDLDSIVTPAGSIWVGTSTAIRVSAHDLGSTDSLTILVDWKDGKTSTLDHQYTIQDISLAHTYSTPGTYAVEVTVRDNDGGVTERVVERPIIVAPAGTNRMPTARITRYPPSDPILERTTVTFNGISSTDPDGDSLTYRWDVGDGLTRTGSNTSRSFWDDGSWDVTLIVTDPHGASDTAKTRISIQNVAPVVGGIVTPSGAILAGTSTAIRVWASDSGIYDSLTVQVDWKDGDTSTLPIEKLAFINQEVAHTYSTTGNYPVAVTVRDKDGAASTRAVEKPIVVVGPHTNHPPVARIDGPATGSEGIGLVFSAAKSTDPDGDSLTVTFLSGDGRSQKEYRNTGPRTYEGGWAYRDNGTYVVSVIVADDSGATDTASMAVTVVNSPPTVEWFSIPIHEAVGVPGSIQVTVADSGSADRHTIEVDWGDGSGQTVATADTSIYFAYEGSHVLGGTVFHTYATTGSYSITVIARDDDGGVSSPITSTPVVVFNANQRQTVAGYEAFDLGTLGGNFARPADLNDRGQVVGKSTTGSWAEHAFLWDETGMHDLGTLGHAASEAVRINENGIIAGTVRTYVTGTPDDGEASSDIGTIWQNGVGTTIGSRGYRGFQTRWYEPGGFGWLQSRPRTVRAINASGQIAFVAYGKIDGAEGWLWNGSWERLSVPGSSLYATAMNDRGQIVGGDPDYQGLSHALLWQNGSARDLGFLSRRTCGTSDCSTALAMDINEAGQVVGISKDSIGRFHFVLWEDNKIKDLGSADWASPQRAARIFINDRGDIAGSAAGLGYFWSGGVKTSLPSLGGSLEVVGLNADGNVVGTILTGAQQHAFVWSQDRGMIDLGTGPHGFSAAWVVDSNARGDILGYTAPCKLSGNRCADGSVSISTPASQTQVRAILWRKQ